MRNRTLALIAVLGLFGPAASATELDLFLTWNGYMDEITVGAGSVITYEVSGVLSDDSSLGLAGFSFDLEFDGGDLPQAETGPYMSRFEYPSGFNNAAGFGGMTDVPGREGDLVQIGGAQNTIKNVDTMPNGLVWREYCQLPGGHVLATGSLTVPETPGTYTLSIPAGSVIANVIKAGETGDPFWATEAAPLGTSSDLSLAISVIDRPVVTRLEVFYADRFDNEADPSHRFLAPGSTATLDNITNCLFGITGIRLLFSHAVDFTGNPEDAFAFEWTTNNGTTFAPVVDPTGNIAIAAPELNGVTEVTITLVNDYVRKRWLKVTIDATQVTANGTELDGELTGNPVVLPGGDGGTGGDAIFFLGNVPGDVCGDRKTLLNDVGMIRAEVNPFLNVPITDMNDCDKDGKVLLPDVAGARLDVNPFACLPLLSP